MFMRVVPTSDALGSADDLSNLLEFAVPPPDEGQGGSQIYLVMFGLYLDRTQVELETGERDPIRSRHNQGIKGKAG